jgi:hypothetical protein
MECTRWNKHTFLLNERQKQIMKYYQNANKPKCKYCNRSSNVVGIVHSNKSKSLNKVYYLTGVIHIGYYDNKILNYLCKKCERAF